MGELLFWTIFLSMIFYLLGLLFVGIYLKFTKLESQKFDKAQIDNILNELDLKFAKKEREFKNIKDEIEIFSRH